MEQIIKEAVYKYQPIIYLHRNENYFPIDFDNYICESKLKETKTGNIITKNYLTPQTLKNITTQNPHINNEKYTLFLPKGTKSKIFKNKVSLNEIPVYYHILKSQIRQYEFYINYVHMYAYNGSVKMCKLLQCLNLGEHYADKEHITVHLVYDPIKKETKMKRIYFSIHNGGVWLDLKDIIFEDGHPVIFSAFHSHASYNNEKVHYRFWGITKDPCDKGHRWFSKNIINLKDVKWINFKGDLGNGHVSNFINDYWWKKPDINENYKDAF